MSTTSKLTTTIGLWLDTTSDSPHDGGTWIVSRDKIDAKGNAEQSRTLATFGPDDYTEAREEAMRFGVAENLPVIEMDECGRRETIREIEVEYQDGSIAELDDSPADELYCGNCGMDYSDMTVAALAEVCGRRPCPACKQYLATFAK